MLRLYQQIGAHLRVNGLVAAAYSRHFADLPIPRPDSVKPFDPNGSLSQLESYLDEDSKLLGHIRKITSLLGDLDRRVQERKKNAPKEMNWTAFQEQSGYPPELVNALKTTMEAEKAAIKQPPVHNEFMDFYKSTVQPAIVKEQAAIRARLAKCQAALKDLDEMEAKLDDLTVDELLEKNPQIAQEIKEELEAGKFY